MTALEKPAIVTRGLSKRYRDRAAVTELAIEVPRGVVAGFIGPNGAGKTTTMRMLVGLIRPSAGDGEVLGLPLSQPERYLPRVGALIEGPAFYPALSGEQNLRVAATVGGLDTGRIPAVLERVGLSDRSTDPYRTYSLGMKQRLGIAAALLGEPELLILDEPANGLDPSGIREMRTLLRSLNADGHTVFVSSHLLGELQQIADWLIVIAKGRVLFQGPATELIATDAAEIRIACEQPHDLGRLLALLTDLGIPGVLDDHHIRVHASEVWRSGDQQELRTHLAEVNRSAMNAGIALAEISIAKATLEDRYEALLAETV